MAAVGLRSIGGGGSVRLEIIFEKKESAASTELESNSMQADLPV